MTALLFLIKGKCLKTESCAEELVRMSLGRVWWELRLLHSGTAGRGHGRCGHVTCPYLPVPMNLSAQNGDYLAIASTAECGGVGEKPLFLLPRTSSVCHAAHWRLIFHSLRNKRKMREMSQLLKNIY